RGGAHKGKHYIGCYKGYTLSGRLRSLSGKLPRTGMTIPNGRSQARANSSGYEINTFYNEIMLQVLYLIFYKNRYSQGVLGKGYLGIITGNNAFTGVTNTLGNGGNYGSTSDDTVKVKFLWIEDWYGCGDELIEGILANSSMYYVTNEPNLFNDNATNYTQYKIQNRPYSGWSTMVYATNELGFLPRSVEGGSSTTYYCDYVNVGSDTDAIVAASFGYSYGGAFSWCVNILNSMTGMTRLCYI
ncbi:MAG: hypothetical protein RR490_09865, partial [Niameybacter sp.]